MPLRPLNNADIFKRVVSVL